MNSTIERLKQRYWVIWGGTLADLGEVPKARGFYDRQLVLLRQLGDRQGEADALERMAVSFGSLGETPKSIELHGQSLALYRELGDRRGEANALWNTALGFDELGRRLEAIGLGEESLLEQAKESGVTALRRGSRGRFAESTRRRRSQSGDSTGSPHSTT